LDSLERDTKLVLREPRREVYYYEIASEFLVDWIRGKAEEQQRLAEQRKLAEAQRAAEEAQRTAEEQRQQAEEHARHAEQLRRLNEELKAERNRAEQQARISFSRELAAAAINNLDIDPERSVLLALHAMSVTHSINEPVIPEAEDALHRAVQASRARLALAGHTNTVNGVAFSPDGTRLATASLDNTAKVWDAASGQEVFTLAGHTAEVLGIAFSPDGTRLATASTDQTGKVWDAASGQEVLTLAGHTNRVSSVAFSPDGRRLASAS
jgi:predicted NACHT family NTPase